MSGRLIRVFGVIALASAAAVLSAAASGRTAKPEAVLRIPRGSAKVMSKGHVKPVLTASFVVDNTGSATVAHFRGWLELVAGSHTTVLHRYTGGPLEHGRHATLTAKLQLPRDLAKRNWSIDACVVLGTSEKAKPAKNSCRRLGRDDLAPKAPAATKGTTTATTVTPTPTTATTTGVTPPTTTTPTTVPPPQVPTAPVSYQPNQWFFEPDGRGQYEAQANDVDEQQASEGDAAGFFTSGYWAVVPPSYDSTNETPETLIVWMHGCDGSAESDSYALSSQFNGDRPYIVISLNGPESEGNVGGPACWDAGDQTDVSQVLADITNAETHFNIDRRRVIIAGYSSGGDLAWLTMFTHAATFAGILADNTNPVRDNAFGGNGIGAAISEAAWKFNGIQLSHSSDDVYHVDACSGNCPMGDPSGTTDPDVGVRPQITALDNAGFNVTLTVKAGNHYNADTPVNCDYQDTPCTGGTSYDIVHSLLNTVGNDGWEAPSP
jgi:pimeloyl-ACP methyl ester carboxylesterase